MQRAEKKYDKHLFKLTAVVNFLDAIDESCRLSLESVFTEFKDHSWPVVETDVMLDFIDQAPAVFGPTWDKMCEWRGVTNRKKDAELNISKQHQVFFQLLSMARGATQKKLKH